MTPTPIYEGKAEQIDYLVVRTQDVYTVPAAGCPANALCECLVRSGETSFDGGPHKAVSGLFDDSGEALPV